VKDVGFIALTYVITFGVVITLVVSTLVAGRRLSRQVRDEDKPWI
jgi:heme exporter protein CcmD